MEVNLSWRELYIKLKYIASTLEFDRWRQIVLNLSMHDTEARFYALLLRHYWYIIESLSFPVLDSVYVSSDAQHVPWVRLTA